MAVVSIAGSEFSFTYNSTTYTSQVTSGTITATPTIERSKTLDDTAFTLTDLAHTVSCEFLYDEEDGFFGAVNTAAIAGSGVAVDISSTDAKFTGTLYCEGLTLNFAAGGVATASGSFTGTLTLADIA